MKRKSFVLLGVFLAAIVVLAAFLFAATRSSEVSMPGAATENRDDASDLSSILPEIRQDGSRSADAPSISVLRQEQGEKMMREIRQSIDKRNAKYKPTIDRIRSMPDGPEREKLINEIVYRCGNNEIRCEDGAYVVLEKHRYEMARGKFHFLYVTIALDQYGDNYEAKIGVLNEAIKALKTQDLEFDRYHGSFLVRTKRDKAVVIKDLKKRIAEIERLKADEGMPRKRKHSEPAQRQVGPMEIVSRPGLSQEEAVVDLEAGMCFGNSEWAKARELWDSIGDRENAAAALMRSGGEDIDASLRAVCDVVEQYPDTRQATLAGYRKAELYLRAGRTVEFAKEMEKFVAEHPGDECAGTGLGELAMQARKDGRPEDAIRYYEQCERWYREHKNAVNPMVIGELSGLYMENGETEKADKLIADVLEGLKSETLVLPNNESDVERATTIQQLEMFREGIKTRAGQNRR